MDNTSAPPRMKHSSWYLPADVADEFAAAVADLYHTTRRPKHVVLSAAVAVALEHQDEILARLGGGEA